MPSVGNPLPHDTLHRFSRTGLIVKTVLGARVIAKLELCQIAVQVLLAAMLVASRMRWARTHAGLYWISRTRLSWCALMSFLLETIR